MARVESGQDSLWTLWHQFDGHCDDDIHLWRMLVFLVSFIVGCSDRRSQQNVEF